MSAVVKVKALKSFDLRNFAFDDKQPPSKDNPVSVPVKPGDVIELPEADVEFNVAVGNVEAPAADAATP